MKNSNIQSAATLNQIDNQKPNIPTCETTLPGTIAGSLNGGHHKIIAYKVVMAGERHKQMNLKINIQMLTPITPTFQKLRGEIETHFVPNSRIWKNAEEFTAQRGGSTTQKVTKIPNSGGQILQWISTDEMENGIPVYVAEQSTIGWRDSYISAFFPRQGLEDKLSAASMTSQGSQQKLPEESILPLRAVKAIWNDKWRNKEYDEELKEYFTDDVSNEEWQSYRPFGNITNQNLNHDDNCYYTFLRARKNNSYYTNYRTELQGEETESPNLGNDAVSLLDWMSWEHKADLVRQETLDSQLNTWDVISRIRGSKLLTEGKVQCIGRKNFELNYSAITQNTYNNNEQVAEEFRVMGKQGAYSYTYLDMPIYAGFEAVEEGILIISMHIYADTIFETGFERTLLNVNKEDQYRPELKDNKEDVIYKIESDSEFLGNDVANHTPEFKAIYGFKRRFSEYYKLPSVVQGDMTTKPWYNVDYGNTQTTNEVITNNTYQFFMPNIQRYKDAATNDSYWLDIWKDYTDIMINKNLAIPFEAIEVGDDSGYLLGFNGQNQIFYGGELMLKAELPMDKDIENDYTEYGEH